MARKTWFMTLIGIILSSAFSCGTGFLCNTVQACDLQVDEVDRRNILEATVRITLFAPVLDEDGNVNTFEVNGELQRELTVGEGLGTLVRAGGETVIVTHDHWSLLTENLYKVQFHTARSELLLELEGSVFSRLIRFRDGGTLILVAPDLISAQMSAVEPAGEAAAMRQGDPLLVAYWQPDSIERVGVEPVVVVNIEQHQGLPSTNMRSLNDKVVIHGNSGGGVFLNGRLVGNMWKTSIEQQLVDGEESGMVSPTTLSRATQFSYDRYFVTQEAPPVALWNAQSEG